MEGLGVFTRPVSELHALFAEDEDTREQRERLRVEESRQAEVRQLYLLA